MASHVPDTGPAPAGRFESTHWSVVLAARDRGEPGAGEALAELCSCYWYPLYAFVRHKGHGPEDAADLTQEFFTRFLEKNFLAAVDRGKGRFRSFLMVACTHFLANQHDRERALKRGGGLDPVSIDLLGAEDRYHRERSHTLTPERLFERRWALTLLDQVLEQLGREFHQAGKGRLYDRLKVILVGADGAVSYALVADALGMTEGAVKKAAQRLRRRYREILRDRIALTVEELGQVEDEIRALFAILGG